MPIVQSGAQNFVVPDVYIYVQPPSQAVTPLVLVSLNAFVGGGNWGPTNSPQVTSDATSAFAMWGNDTASANALLVPLLTAMTEDGNAVSVRASDGTDTAATILELDGSSGTVFTLTAKYTGSLPNGNAALGVGAATCTVTLISGTTSSFPVYRITITFPNAAPEVFDNILGGGLSGYVAATFIANALAAINGTAQNSVGSQRWVATGGSSTIFPQSGVAFAATGGTDGTGTLTLTAPSGTGGLIGKDVTPRVGMYALRNTGFFQLVLSGMGSSSGDLTSVTTLSAFVQSENAALGIVTFPKGMSDASAISLRATDAVFNSNIVLVKDWILWFDPVQSINRYVPPSGKAAGIIGQLPPADSTINQPYNTTGNGAAYVIGTEMSAIGPRSLAELGALVTNGIIAITNQTPLGNGAFGIFDDVVAAGNPASNNGAGTFIPVIRMNAFLAQSFASLGGQFVGQTQSTSPNDPLRTAVEATYNNFLAGLKPAGGEAQIDYYSVTCDLTNNTPTSIAAGYCYVKVLVRFLGIVRFFYVTLQGGTSVTVSSTPPQVPA